MKILLIYPSPDGSYHNRSILQRTFLSLMPTSQSLMILASLVPDDYNVKIIDERFERINFEEDYDLIGLSCYTFNVLRGYEIADIFRKKGKTVVIGGWHASCLPEEVKGHADSVVIGEAEETWPQLLKDFEARKLKLYYKQIRPVPPKKIPIPRRDLIYSKIRNASLMATRGCPIGCEFCSAGTMDMIRVFRPRPVEDVIKEIQTIKQKNIVFNDPSLTIHPKYSKQLFKEMSSLNKKFICDGNINVLGKDDEFLKLASEAGCLEWEIGFETVSQQTLNSVGKITNLVEDYKAAIKKIQDHGIGILGCFVFGFDTDTKESLRKTIAEINRIKLSKVLFNVLTPFPSTRLYQRLEKEGRIISKDWSKYNGRNVVFKPKNFTAEGLQAEYNDISKNFYTTKEIIKRFLRSDRKQFNLTPLLFPSNEFFLQISYK